MFIYNLYNTVAKHMLKQTYVETNIRKLFMEITEHPFPDLFLKNCYNMQRKQQSVFPFNDFLLRKTKKEFVF